MRHFYAIKSDSPIRARFGSQDSYLTYVEVKKREILNSWNLSVVQVAASRIFGAASLNVT
jgi:hypothetical protein